MYKRQTSGIEKIFDELQNFVKYDSNLERIDLYVLDSLGNAAGMLVVNSRSLYLYQYEVWEAG